MKGPDLTSWPHFPFCSQRCKLVDLGRWFNESYHVPVEEPDAAPIEEMEVP
jgi:endogenous inhibitor of DNA gyrase (YacG/DUF329 family)